ncbi:MAG: gliding motility-associated C-terminal domain-containing protein, partial [Crocinitomicaceae bacterium]|nr:gliding motility-associated C-terminal domain-containing protein [Crocinitomicaceae bacterium]
SCLADFATFDVVVNDQPDAGLDGNSTICNSAGSTIDLNTLLSGADPGGTWAETTASGQFTPGTGVFDASGLASGTYSFTYTIIGSAPCLDDVANFDIVVNQMPNAGGNGNSTLCNSSGSTIDLNNLLSGADPGGTWAETTASGQFTPGTGTFDASGLTAGTYSFTYTVSGTAPCLDAVANFDVVVNQEANAGANGNSTLCNSAGSTLDLNTLLSGADTGGTWAETTASGQFTPGSGVFDASGLTSGTYSFTYTVTGTAPCLDDIANFDITVTDLVDAGNDNNTTICDNNGAFDVSTLLDPGVTAGGAWSETSGSPSGQFTAGTSSFDPTGLNGTFTFLYSIPGSGSCLGDDATMTVTVNSQPNAGLDGNSSICNSTGSTIDLNTLLSGADAGGTWMETTASGQFNTGTGVFDASGLTVGTYTFTYTVLGTAPCVDDVATFDITVTGQPVAGGDGNSTLCNSAGSTLDLNTLLSGADPGGTWAETTSSGQFTTGTGVFDASSLSAGTYSFTYSFAASGSCLADVANFDVVVNNQPNAGLDGNTTLCNSAGTTLDLNTLLSGADAGGTWAETTSSGQFNTGTGVLDASGLAAGTYTFTYTITATAPCVDAVATFDVSISNQPNAGTDASSTLCNSAGSTLDLNTLLSGADAGGTWAETTSSGQFTAGTGVFDASGLTAGTYSFTYTLIATAPCVDDMATFDITVTGSVTAGADNSATICSDNGAFDVSSLLDATANAGGTWTETSGTPSGQFTAGSATLDPSGLNGTFTFDYTLAGSGTCLGDNATMTITINPVVNAGADGNSSLCNTAGSTLDLNTLLSGADPGGTWAETTSSGQFNTGTGVFDASNLGAGTYTFTYTLTATAPCVDDAATFTVNVVEQPNAGANAVDTLCNTGATINLNTLLSGADPGGTWTETTSSGQFNASTGVFDANGLAGGNYVFEYTLAGAGSCPSATSTFTITVTAAPAAPTLSGGGTFCENDNITLTANGSGGTITWYTDPNLNNVFQTGPNATFTVPLGTNTFYVVEDNGCQGAVGTISVTGIPGPTLDVPPVITACVGDVVTITGSSNATILWSTGDTTATISFTATADTFVVATVMTSCDTLIDTVQISVFPPFDVDAGPDQTVPAGAVTTIEATSASAISSVSWTPGTFLDCSTCAITDVAPTQDVTYIVNAMDENGCTASDTITIFVDGEITVYIPNIFSPNGDGQNDTFGPLGGTFTDFKMEIFNRWGGLIWSTEEPNVKWPGTTMKGEPCPQAVFVYKIWGKFYTGQIFERSGNVMLTR